jgi:hypothetical protein
VKAAFLPAALSRRVRAAFLPAALSFLVLAAFFAAARRSAIVILLLLAGFERHPFRRRLRDRRDLQRLLNRTVFSATIRPLSCNRRQRGFEVAGLGQFAHSLDERGWQRCLHVSHGLHQLGGDAFVLSDPENRRINVFGIDLAVSIMDGDDLSEHRRKELALARLMAETIGVILYTAESEVDVRIDAAKDMIREFKHVYPDAVNI